MYCPQCGQQRLSDELRFCSRCGFQLNGVAQLLAAGGELPAPSVIENKKRRSPRAEGVRQGVLIIFLAMVLVPLSNVLKPHGEILPVTLMMFALMRILYAVIFQEGDARRKRREAASSSSSVPPPLPQQLNAGTRGSALPPPQSIPVSDHNARRAQTAEMVQPPSVTERTTKLLDNRDEFDTPKS
jgi:hypothetical protein